MFEKIFANRWASLVLVAINLGLAAAYVVVVAPPALFADEPDPNGNPCLVQCKSDCYDFFATEMYWCSIEPYYGCESDANSLLQSCKNGCYNSNTCGGTQ